METIDGRIEEFDSLTNPRFLALTQARAHTDKELTEEDIKQEWRKGIGSVQYSVFGIIVKDNIQYFGSKRDEAEQKISNYNNQGLATEILKSLEGLHYNDATLSIDQVTNELVISRPGEAGIRIPEKGEPSSN